VAKVEAGALISSSWEFFSKHINKLWQVALLLSLPNIISPFLVDPKPTLSEEEVEGITSLSGFTETVFGVSPTEAGVMLMIWLIITAIYSATVYGGSISGLLAALRGHADQLSFSGVWSAGWKKFASLILLGIVVGVIVGVGIVLLVIPGLIAAFLLAFSPYFLIDKNQTVSQSMSSSYNLVKNNVGSVFIVWLLVFLVVIAVNIVTGIILSSTTNDVILALKAVVSGFVSVFTLIAASKLYMALTHHSSSATSAE
jgi:uncharacterized membrane protein